MTPAGANGLVISINVLITVLFFRPLWWHQCVTHWKLLEWLGICSMRKTMRNYFDLIEKKIICKYLQTLELCRLHFDVIVIDRMFE